MSALTKGNKSLGIIVTGSTGFIGKHLVEYLARRDYQIIAANRRLSSRSDDHHNGTNFNSAITNFKFALNDHSSIKSLFEQNRQNSQVVIHLAAIMDFHPENEEKIARMRQINIDSSVKMFEEFLESKEKKLFIYTSTQAAMGYSKVSGQQMDESSVCEPTFEYGKTKLETEKKLKEMMDDYILKGNSTPKHLYILRLTGVTGKGDTYAAFELIQASAYGLNSLVYPGDCNKGFVSFVHISDVCKAIEKCIEKAMVSNVSSYKLYIIGPKESISMKNAIDCLCEATGWPRPRVSIPLSWFRGLVGTVSPLINWVRGHFFGFGRASFLFAPETIDCMEQNHAFSSRLAMNELGYNPMTTREAFLTSVKEHSNLIPSKKKACLFQYGCLTCIVMICALFLWKVYYSKLSQISPNN